MSVSELLVFTVGSWVIGYSFGNKSSLHIFVVSIKRGGGDLSFGIFMVFIIIMDGGESGEHGGQTQVTRSPQCKCCKIPVKQQGRTKPLDWGAPGLGGALDWGALDRGAPASALH